MRSLALLLVLIATPASAAVREVCNTGGSGLNFRSGPSLHAAKKDAFVEGHDLTVLGRSANGEWMRVRDNGSGRIGWVHGAYTCPRRAASRERVASNGTGGTAAPKGGSCNLGETILSRARMIGNEINRTGGYRFDGRNDCYGFVRRVWDPVLSQRGMGALPTSDVGSTRWVGINWDALRPGDVLATHRGHMWGPNWHGGLYAGKKNGVHYIYDNSGSRSAQLRPLPSSTYFRYVFRPTHGALVDSCQSGSSSGGKGGRTVNR